MAFGCPTCHPSFGWRSPNPPFETEVLHRGKIDQHLLRWASLRTLLSQFFSRSFESILPTSLIYITLSTLGCSPRRPAADIGTVILLWSFLLLVFPCTNRAHRPPEKIRMVSISSTPVSIKYYSKGILKFIKKRKLFPRLRLSLPTALGYPNNSLTGWFRNINLVPFRRIIIKIYDLSYETT